ncbi:hypothetical protein [Phaeacidiphilus oryzae]|uniref:hypothetical protein n=1 Tax=Phaeacidiphilus oryzae TaxID=348818 RepID=UPI00126993E6|nr:hypothetical protein [Phaeacidiphilus oryzae]
MIDMGRSKSVLGFGVSWLVAAALALTACGSSSTNSAVPPSSASATTPGADAAALESWTATYYVNIQAVDAISSSVDCPTLGGAVNVAADIPAPPVDPQDWQTAMSELASAATTCQQGTDPSTDLQAYQNALANWYNAATVTDPSFQMP